MMREPINSIEKPTVKEVVKRDADRDRHVEKGSPKGNENIEAKVNLVNGSGQTPRQTGTEQSNCLKIKKTKKGMPRSQKPESWSPNTQVFERE